MTDVSTTCAEAICYPSRKGVLNNVERCLRNNTTSSDHIYINIYLVKSNQWSIVNATENDYITRFENMQLQNTSRLPCGRKLP